MISHIRKNPVSLKSNNNDSYVNSQGQYYTNVSHQLNFSYYSQEKTSFLPNILLEIVLFFVVHLVERRGMMNDRFLNTSKVNIVRVRSWNEF